MSGRVWNILIGMGSLLDIYTSADYSKYMREINHSPQNFGSFQTDAENLCGDWINVGNDLRQAMTEFDAENTKKT